MACVCVCVLLQGFTREITLPRERWVGFIKDYDGGTLMECIIHPKVPYTDLVNLFRVSDGGCCGSCCCSGLHEWVPPLSYSPPLSPTLTPSHSYVQVHVHAHLCMRVHVCFYCLAHPPSLPLLYRPLGWLLQQAYILHL